MNRLRPAIDAVEAERFSLPHPPAATPTPAGFMACPGMCCQSMSDFQRYVYEMAFAQAQAVVRPSLPERDRAGVWN
jgi:hypothetical protein